MIRTILLTLSLILIGGTTPPSGDNPPTVWYTTENTINAGSIIGDSDGPIPTDRTYCYVYGLGNKHINSGGSAGTANFTGIYDLNPIGLGQRGLNDNWYGSTACQMRVTATNRWGGFQLHKDSITANNTGEATGSLYGMQLVRNWGTDLTRKPWMGEGSVVELSANYAVQARDTTAGTIQYGQLVLSLVDTTTPPTSENRSIWLTVSLWDSRGTHTESVHADTGGTPNYIIDTYLASGLQYVGVGAGSQLFDGSGACACRSYTATMSRTNLVDAITAVNTQMFTDNPTRTPYTLNPDDWAVNFIGGGTEMFSPTGSTGWIGSRLSNLTLTTRE